MVAVVPMMLRRVDDVHLLYQVKQLGCRLLHFHLDVLG
jgi:hypothetical protein